MAVGFAGGADNELVLPDPAKFFADQRAQEEAEAKKQATPPPAPIKAEVKKIEPKVERSRVKRVELPPEPPAPPTETKAKKGKKKDEPPAVYDPITEALNTLPTSQYPW